jgi:hypothetical protein
MYDSHGEQELEMLVMLVMLAIISSTQPEHSPCLERMPWQLGSTRLSVSSASRHQGVLRYR